MVMIKKVCGKCRHRTLDSDLKHYICRHGDKLGNRKRVRKDQKACSKFN